MDMIWDVVLVGLMGKIGSLVLVIFSFRNLIDIYIEMMSRNWLFDMDISRLEMQM